MKFFLIIIVLSSYIRCITTNHIYNRDRDIDNTVRETSNHTNDETDCDDWSTIVIDIDNTNVKSTHFNTISINKHETNVINDPSGEVMDRNTKFNNESNGGGGGQGSSVNCRRPCGNTCCEPGESCTADGLCGEICGLGNFCLEGEKCCEGVICCPDIKDVECRKYGPVLQCAIIGCNIDDDRDLPCDTGNGFGKCIRTNCCPNEAVCKSTRDDSLMCCDGSDQYCSDNGYCESKCGDEELYCDYPNTQCCTGSNGLGSCCLDNFHCCHYVFDEYPPPCCPEGWECCGSGCIDPTISVCCGGVECQFEGYCCNEFYQCIQRPKDSDCDEDSDCCDENGSLCSGKKCCPADKRCGPSKLNSKNIIRASCCSDAEYCCDPDKAECCWDWSHHHRNATTSD